MLTLFKNWFRPTTLLLNFGCSTLNNPQYGQLDHASNFYRNSIRRININSKGRGKFTEHHLIKLSKLTTKPTQISLLFEGYYNYLGHMTPISSRTVDRMLEKALEIGQEQALEPTFEVFSNHNYLAYFPHYRVTLKLIELVQNEEQKMKKLMQIFHVSPLIKFDHSIINKLITIATQQGTTLGCFSSITKLLLQRSVLNLIEQHLKKQELLQKISQSLQSKLQNGFSHILSSNQYIKQFINRFQSQSEQQSYQLCIVGLTFGLRYIVYQKLLTLKQEEKINRFLKYLEHCPETYSRSVRSYLQSQQLPESLSSKLQA